MYACVKCSQTYFDQDGAASCSCSAAAAIAAKDETKRLERPGPIIPPNPTPTIGRVVHYFPREGECRQWASNEQEALPAVITHVWESTVNLKVLADGGNQDWAATSIPEGTARGCYAWPPRV